MIAALFVETNGIYFGSAGRGPLETDEQDATTVRRSASGGRPSAVRPWCQMAPVNQARYGHRIGDDGGCFAAALAAVRQFGGVLEHPALSLAWPAFDLARPLDAGWIKTFCGGWVAQVEQRHYGHPARKATWLYVHGSNPPSLKWGPGPHPEAWISTDRPRKKLAALGIRQLSKRDAKATPPEFRNLLLSIARDTGL